MTNTDTPCSWCGTVASEATLRHEGPHLTWCPRFKRGCPLCRDHEADGIHEACRAAALALFPGLEL